MLSVKTIIIISYRYCIDKIYQKKKNYQIRFDYKLSDSTVNVAVAIISMPCLTYKRSRFSDGPSIRN